MPTRTMARCVSELGRGIFAIGWNTMQPNWKEMKGKMK